MKNSSGSQQNFSAWLGLPPLVARGWTVAVPDPSLPPVSNVDSTVFVHITSVVEEDVDSVIFPCIWTSYLEEKIEQYFFGDIGYHR